MTKKLLSVIISIFMALSTALLLPVQVAAKQPTYIKDLIIGTGLNLEDTINSIKRKGYTPIEKNLNKGNGTIVLMGYLETDNKDEAITDIAAMTEKSGYSFAQYETILQEKEDTVETLVEKFKDAIEEFRENYDAEEPAALIAYNMLNKMTNDDMNNIGIGDMLISEDTTEAQLKTVFMQTRTEFLVNIEEYLALACNSNNWIDELENCDNDGTYEPTIADDARRIYNTLKTFQTSMNEFLQFGIDENSTQDEINAFLNTATETEKKIFSMCFSSFKILKGITYLDRNLFDLLMTDLNSLDMSLLYPMASLMTPGQIATIEYIPFITSVTNNSMDEDSWEEQLNTILTDSQYTEAESVSVFAGVDRTIFNPQGIAVTSQALLRQNVTAESIVKEIPLLEHEEAICSILGALSFISVLATISLKTSIKNLAISFTTKELNRLNICKAFLDQAYDSLIFKYTTIFTKVYNVCLGITIATILILLAVITAAEIIKSKVHPKYSEMPRIIVDIDITKSDDYVYYYAVKDTAGIYADVNAWDGEKWTGIYYTKDKAAGNPLTVECLVNYGLENNSAPTSADKTYRPVHYFGENAAYNLNRNSNYNKTVSTSNYIYMYFVEASTVTTASVFNSTAGYALSGFGGLLAGAVATLLITGKKNKKKDETVPA